ncbi:hypothetical protein HPP92_016801 [Vanilla planifolia]|uniref:Elongin-A n=1 Tax=Vanilla planifolia TaxID=51239 RepID=A0A835QFW0_VANPL|nr:hypothetical protein HPP92_016801 [Vanilla planifolia]
MLSVRAKIVMGREVPSLVKLCIGSAIANLRYIGDVGALDMHLLKDILPHCTIDQLMNIEKSAEGVDLSPVTNDLWRKFYEKRFGDEHAKLVTRRMNQKQVVFKWRQLYEAKTKEREDFQNKSAERLKQRYDEELAKRQSKQIQICSKVPPSANKRSFFSVSGHNVSHLKSSLMKKARLEYLQSNEVANAAMRKNAVQRKSLPTQSLSGLSKPISFPGKGSASTSQARYRR